MKSILILLLTYAFGISWDKTDIGFQNYLKAEDTKFLNYKKALDREYAKYQEELKVFWKNPKLSTKKSWLTYSKDKKSRVDVDFEQNELTVEVIAKNRNEAQTKLAQEISYVLSKTTADVVKSDELQKRVALLQTDAQTVTSKIDSKPILANIFFTKEPTQKELTLFSKNLFQTSKISEQKSKVKKEKVYTINFKMPKNATLKRSKIYIKDIKRNAKRFKIREELILAIMHTESWFNPFAKSHIPAFGLMQIVPSSAGRDTYKLLYKRDAKPSASYLYNSKNNIEMGTSYLYILYYRYLRFITNPQSRLYCTIAAYNTGAGNVAWAFTRTYNVKRAASLINSLSPDEVYSRLLQDLRYDEPKRYLKNVRQRMYYYKKEYSL